MKRSQSPLALSEISGLRRIAGTPAIFLVLTALFAASLAGCGGSGGASGVGASVGRGAATLSITWPERSRLIPVASNSITVAFLNSSNLNVGQKTVARPTSGNSTTVSFTGLPAGTLNLRAQAYPTTDGTGTAQASASKSVVITSGQTTAAAITMASTIETLAISPSAPTVATGATVALVPAALNSSGAAILVSSGTLVYSSSDATVATVSSGGIVTGVAAGTATITLKETESGKSATVTVTVTANAGGSIVDLANTYIASLSSGQQAATVVTGNAANVAKWSNLPATPSGTLGTNSLRNGVSFSTLTDAQKTAFLNLAQAALGTQGFSQFSQIRASDDYLGTLQGGYSGNYEYIGIVGTPSATGTWTLQIGGHHIAHNYTYVGTALQTSTPYFLGVEPQSFTQGGTTYTPLQSQRNGMYNLINSLTATQLTSAKLSSSFSDVYLGPGKDARSNFPSGTTGRGLLASNLSTAQQTLLKTAIAAWTQNSAQASTYQSLYEGELSQMYVAYSGTTTFNNQGDYVRIDGPHVWIEFVCQNGVVLSGIHFHTIWRDRVSDYNAAYGF